MNPLGAVRDALAEGVLGRVLIAKQTGLHPATVDAILEHLTRTGELDTEVLASCPGGSCGSCTTGCPSHGPLILTLRKSAPANPSQPVDNVQLSTS